MWKIICAGWGGGGGFLSLAGWPTEGRWYAGSLGENVDEREIPKLCCDS